MLPILCPRIRINIVDSDIALLSLSVISEMRGEATPSPRFSDFDIGN
jgi:hypothetical protein